MIQDAKLKLIYVVTQAELGGAQKYIFDLASSLKNEFDVIVSAGRGESSRLLEECSKVGIRTHKFKHLTREINPVKDIAAIFELAQFFKKEQPSIIHLNSSKAGFIGALAVKKLNAKRCTLNAKIVYTAHGWVFNEPLSWWRKKLYICMERIACKIHDRVIALSGYDFAVANKNKICTPEKLTIIPHGIRQVDFFDHKTSQQHLKSLILNLKSNIWVGTIANLYKTKGIEYLIEAATMLKKEGLEPNFIVIGSGPMEKSYKLQVIRYKLNNFLFAGSIPDAARYLKAFDIFVLPSVKEGMPYAILEAMQAELPIIASAVGAIPEMIDSGKNGLLTQPQSATALAAAIRRFLSNETIGKKCGEEAKKTCEEKFSFEIMINETIKIYYS